MPETDSDDVERLAPQSLWHHEALDFTPWLAAHLDLLGKAIGLRLELVGQEHPVGQLSLDILARDTEANVRVAIENQLAAANLSHLGQLITYATGSDAPVAVWVATAFRRELADALHRLNAWTGDEIRFYAVRLEVIQRAPDAEPEPRLRKVVWPGGLDESLVLAAAEPSPDAQRHRDFFAPLIAELRRSRFADRPVQYFDHTGRFFRSPLERGVGYAAAFGNSTAYVALYISMDKNAVTKHVFDKLHADRASIEAELADMPHVRWTWHRHDRFTYSSINVVRAGAIHDPPDRLAETRMWMLDALPRLQAVLDQRLAAILEDLHAPDST